MQREAEMDRTDEGRQAKETVPSACLFQEQYGLAPGERLDDLQREGAKLIQNPDLFCFGMDAVLLAAFAERNLKPGSRVLDLCSGNGVVPILMEARWRDRQRGDRRAEAAEKPAGQALSRGTHAEGPGAGGQGEPGADLQTGPERQEPGPSFLGLELQRVSADMAKRSAKGNGQEEAVSFRCGDLRRIRDLVSPAAYDLVTVNPPYMIGGHGLTGDREERTIARHEVACSLDDVCRAAAYALKPKGKLCMVHRPFRLADLFRGLDACGLEPKRMRLVQPAAGREPNMVLVEAVRGGRPYLAVEAPLLLYEKPGVYTEEVRRLYS